MDQGRHVIGRITLGDDGVRQIVPIDHTAQVLNHQHGVQDLIRAARLFKENEDEESLLELIRVAKAL